MGIVEAVKNMTPSQLLEEMNAYENINNYFYKSVENRGVEYLIAYIQLNDTNTDARGFYDLATSKIKYEDELEEDSVEDRLYGEIMVDIDSVVLESLTPIEYLKNVVTNQVFIDIDGSKIRVGELVDDELQEGETVASTIIPGPLLEMIVIKVVGLNWI